ncbi:hypothetical protein F5888DRAFT_1711227 [Russula emetica]|nr:hypothetical protein F5888DRAFT_1711227 [Russula emetica]
MFEVTVPPLLGQDWLFNVFCLLMLQFKTKVVDPPACTWHMHVDCDGNPAACVIQTVKSAVRVPESEIKRWRQTFEANTKSLIDGEKFLDREQFVNAIAPST